ncbi:flagellar basal-body rod protein FlgF [Teredinibacter sp. KSP-S5-2]|uniref:flagellar basal-body rod protein FlgF n=1 Tax=Teredinibacter sp. KSP-S5-2 TaxID=3034506 RepID=UPI002934D5A0|nr:flagellar basal-body rod protein FlgF [Teredinibacter sp. KSP-S5-2]WNO11333.1 flagellar basal-body rod protein FlgF [Teredinibacter sp. KSP-S5-2]
MLQSFFTGLSGMLGFSKSLDTVSNNVANMNTPGYRGTSTFMRDVVGENGSGFGATVGDTATRTSSGDIKQTGNETDIAIVGEGLFVLQNESGDYFYTRAGQFIFNEENMLVDSTGDFFVMGLNEDSNLERIDISEQRILPPVATTNIDLKGALASTDDSHQITPIPIYDASGISHDLTLTLRNPTDSINLWTVEVTNNLGDILGDGEIRFNSDGSLLENFNQISITTSLSGSEQTINFNFGEPNTVTGARQSLSGASNLVTGTVDGNAPLGLTGVKFNEKGVMILQYSNGDTHDGSQIAVASFSNEQNLERSTGAMFTAKDDQTPTIRRPAEEGMGKIKGESIELSNVDLTQEFADILIIQRGYQASSQVMSVANELIEQLYNGTRG